MLAVAQSYPRCLAIISTHPVQYHAPVFAAVQKQHAIPVHCIYGSDFSVAGYHDREFQASFSWDTDLVGQTHHTFLTRVSTGGAERFEDVSAKGLSAVLNGLRPAAVLLTGYQPPFHTGSFAAAVRNRIPVLFRAETTDHARARGVIANTVRRTALRLMYSLCRRMLPIGKRSYEHYKQLGIPDHKLILSPYCVDVSAFQCDEDARKVMRDATRAQFGAEPDDCVIVFSGKLSERKGPLILAAALKQLPPAIRRRIVLLCVGDGSLRRQLEHVCSSDPVLRMFCTGFQNQTLLSKWYHAADLLALPSVSSETWGLVVNEALHHGVPCIVSDAVGCAPDLVECGVTGDQCATGSAESLSQSISRGLALTNNVAVREACRSRVQRYSVAAAAAGIARAYQECVSEH